MDKNSEILQKANSSLANAYVKKTGLDKEGVLELMNDETWLTAEEAIDYGFADEMVEKEVALVANYAPIIPEQVIEHLNKKEEPKKTNLLGKLITSIK